MDEMNEHDIARQIDRDVSDRGGLIALSLCLAAVAVLVMIGAVVLLRQFS